MCSFEHPQLYSLGLVTSVKEERISRMFCQLYRDPLAFHYLFQLLPVLASQPLCFLVLEALVLFSLPLHPVTSISWEFVSS